MAIKETKTITVSQKIWKRIMKDRIDLGVKTAEEVIIKLYYLVKKIEKSK